MLDRHDLHTIAHNERNIQIILSIKPFVPSIMNLLETYL